MRIAVSGHCGLNEAITRYVAAGIRAALAAVPGDLVGISCLADGADTLFAQAVLDAGGQLHVVVPAAQYRDALPAEHHAVYDSLLAWAATVDRLDFTESDPAAHMAASRHMLTVADQLYAVWDGLPARSWGGTADVVDEARRAGLPVTVIWPPGAVR